MLINSTEPDVKNRTTGKLISALVFKKLIEHKKRYKFNYDVIYVARDNNI